MGINRGGQARKVSLYADDLILYLSEPDSSVPKALDIFIHQILPYSININANAWYCYLYLLRNNTYNVTKWCSHEPRYSLPAK